MLMTESIKLRQIRTELEPGEDRTPARQELLTSWASFAELVPNLAPRTRNDWDEC